MSNHFLSWNSYGVFWFAENIMLQCIEGFKHLGASLVRCCDIDLYKQSRGLEDPELLARETVCMLSAHFVFHDINYL